MTHNRECPKCGDIGVWNWAPKRQRKMLPNGEYANVRVIVEGEEAVKCLKCENVFEPRAHEQLNKALSRVMKEIEN